MTAPRPASVHASAPGQTGAGDAAGGPGNELRLLLILSALMSFASVSTDMYLPALPTISRALHTTSASIELTFSAFLVGFSLGQLLWGPISDRYGRRLPIAIGLVLFTIGSVGCALSTTVTQMMVWRVVQALGACVGPVLSRAMVRDLYGREQSARMLSTLILIMGVAPLVGPLLGGQVLAFWSWQGIFWTLAGIGVLTLASLAALPESLPPARRSATPLRHTLGSYWELLGDVRLMGYALSGGFFYGGAYAFIVGTPFAYIDYYHVSPQAYGWLFGLNIVGMMVANFVNRRLLERFGSERLFHIGTWILALTGIVLAINARFGWGGLPGLVVPIFFYMSMNGLIVANSVAGALSAFAHKAGSASSLLGAMHYGSGILSAAMLGWFSDGTPWTMAWIMALAGIGSLATSAISTRIRAARGLATEASG
ncbi:Drug resistance transporter Bcr/CflA subfamily protein [Azotobacter vinelandii CA]|uniref:Bcr/CflA family efflux transporter n=3 Tax=Azotobacter group TaxID=351 RepID=C1DP43_AZOVD|nr:Drug resistance transporter Bcr/CflA subfamily protein [Azotobacter vinelandii DJ]AGK16395.1 Drug resistance transporter Bcr/CflA subfamily protein [Azotobacter vinelandii CA]AGK21190.1 Drug resistance transporter Bcr/CflA subfamily protein [Azotobacter vinelandii CA6]SFY22105.1 MFS transporter, DHA1 family, bicyclomycin/chloramphenicol resistance protein [Azotobacter vinelandii]